MAVLDTNVDNTTGAEISLTTESVVSVYVLPATGTHKNHRIILQVSPDGTKWRRFGQPIRGIGVETYIVAAAKVRPKVIRPEGTTSTVDVQLVAR